jgi:hypothetical protein
VICGGLHSSALKVLVTEYGLWVKLDVLDYAELSQNYSKVVLAVDFPEISPVIYLKPRKQQMYLKMVPSKTGGFKYERPTPPRIGFYLWLESVKPTLGIGRTRSVLGFCEREGRLRCGRASSKSRRVRETDRSSQ